MNYNISILVAFVFLILATAAERLSVRHVEALQAQRSVLADKLKVLDERASQAVAEAARYKAAEDLVTEIEGLMTPEDDSAAIIQWFHSDAAKLGVTLVSSKVMPLEHREEAKIYRRIRMDVHVHGGYTDLIDYVQSVERSSMPMLIDSCSLSSIHEAPGIYNLALNVSCLFPAAAGKSIGTGGAE